MTAPEATTPAPAPWSDRIVDSGAVPPGSLVHNPLNWRSHPTGQRDALTGALDEVGWVAQVIVNRRSGLVIDGHLRVELALARGEPSVPVTYVDLTEDEERLVLATLDPITTMAEAEAAQLKVLFDGLDPVAEGLRALFDDLERANGLGALLPGLDMPDEVQAVPEESYVRRGDLWMLGPHRLGCGDATSPEDVDRLLDGAQPGMMVTDPPYGVDYDPTWRRQPGRGSRMRDGAVPNDDRADWQAAWALSPAPIAYVWHGGLHGGTVAEGLMAAGYILRAQIVWAKPTPIMGRGAYSWQHEPCFYAVRKGAKGRWAGGNESTVWPIEGVRAGVTTDMDEATSHGTQKPVECMARPMRNHRPMDVYDPFAGAGTSIVAAEQLDRRCFAMDISPAWVQVAKERWETLTGKTAERLVDG